MHFKHKILSLKQSQYCVLILNCQINKQENCFTWYREISFQIIRVASKTSKVLLYDIKRNIMLELLIAIEEWILSNIFESWLLTLNDFNIRALLLVYNGLPVCGDLELQSERWTLLIMIMISSLRILLVPEPELDMRSFRGNHRTFQIGRTNHWILDRFFTRWMQEIWRSEK